MNQGPNPEEIQGLFKSIAAGYDKANDAMTFGLARLWRKHLVQWSDLKAGAQILDCATGTGDLAIEFKRAVGVNGRVVGTDFCPEMLALAPNKAKRLNLEVEFSVADAMELPFADSEFDGASIAYGIRNVSNPGVALEEMARVVRPGGVVMVLETGDAQWPILKTAMQFYFRQLVPRIGGWITGQKSAYEYLNRSSQKFPAGEKFVELMRKTNRFSKIEFKTLLGGASFLYKGIVKNDSRQ